MKQPAKTKTPEPSLFKKNCENCGAISAEHEEMRLCEGCGKVRFCSEFCADYAMKRGVHGKKCVVGPRQFCYFDREVYDDLDHPAKCVICHDNFKENTSLIVVGPCSYKLVLTNVVTVYVSIAMVSWIRYHELVC
jgi:hypothetical protein